MYISEKLNKLLSMIWNFKKCILERNLELMEDILIEKLFEIKSDSTYFSPHLITLNNIFWNISDTLWFTINDKCSGMNGFLLQKRKEHFQPCLWSLWVRKVLNPFYLEEVIAEDFCFLRSAGEKQTNRACRLETGDDWWQISSFI